VARTPDAALLQACTRPDDVPPNPTNADVARSWIDVTAKWVECARLHDGLIAFEKGTP